MSPVLVALGWSLWPVVLGAVIAVVIEFAPLSPDRERRAGTRVFPARVSPPFSGEDAVTGAGAASSPVYDWSKEAA